MQVCLGFVPRATVIAYYGITGMSLYNVGSRSPLEQVLSKFIKPALKSTFTGTNSATISVSCLQQWFTTNCSDWSKTCTSGGEIQSCPVAITVGQKRHFGELEGCSNIRQSGEMGTSNRLDFSTGHDVRSGLGLSNKETKVIVKISYKKIAITKPNIYS